MTHLADVVDVVHEEMGRGHLVFSFTKKTERSLVNGHPKVAATLPCQESNPAPL